MRPPRHGFWKGAALGVLLVIPLTAVAVWILSRMGLADRSATMIHCLRMTSAFAGIAAVLTAGGVGRLTAQASVEGNGRRHAARVGARAMAAGGAALTIIAAIPLGDLPTAPLGWLALAAGGAVAGAIAGAAIGAVCGGALPTLTELGVWPPEGPIEWTRDLLGLDERRERDEPPAPGAAGERDEQ